MQRYLRQRSFDLAEPVRHALGDEDEVALGQRLRNAALDRGAGAVVGVGTCGVDELTAGYYRRGPIDDVEQLRVVIVNSRPLHAGHAMLDAYVVRRQVEDPDITVAVGWLLGDGGGKVLRRHIGSFCRVGRRRCLRCGLLRHGGKGKQHEHACKSESFHRASLAHILAEVPQRSVTLTPRTCTRSPALRSANAMGVSPLRITASVATWMSPPPLITNWRDCASRLSTRPSASAAWFEPVRCCASSVATVSLRVTPIRRWSLSTTAPRGSEASMPGPEKLRTTSIGDTLLNVKFPPASTAQDTLVPATVTVTPEVPKRPHPVRAGPDVPETVPTMVAPALAGVGAGVVVADDAPLGAVREP